VSFAGSGGNSRRMPSRWVLLRLLEQLNFVRRTVLGHTYLVSEGTEGQERGSNLENRYRKHSIGNLDRTANEVDTQMHETQSNSIRIGETVLNGLSVAAGGES